MLVDYLLKTEDSKYIDLNKLDKAFFQHNISYKDFKNLPWKTASDKLLLDKAFNFA